MTSPSNGDSTGTKDLEGKYATIYYVDNAEDMLMDIHYNGKTLYVEYAPEIDKTFKKITGLLSGAENQTPGVLPSKTYITEKNGDNMAFKEFVTAEIKTKNEKTVTGYY